MATKEYNDKLIYLGMRATNGGFDYLYGVVEGEKLGTKIWRFTKQLFKKGGVGAIYDCRIDGDTVHYSKSNVPTYMVNIGGKWQGTSIAFKEVIHEAEVLHEQATTIKRNSTRQPTKMDYDIEDIRRVYNSLHGAQKPRFIADLVYKITK